MSPPPALGLCAGGGAPAGRWRPACTARCAASMASRCLWRMRGGGCGAAFLLKSTMSSQASGGGSSGSLPVQGGGPAAGGQKGGMPPQQCVGIVMVCACSLHRVYRAADYQRLADAVRQLAAAEGSGGGGGSCGAAAAALREDGGGSMQQQLCGGLSAANWLPGPSSSRLHS